MKMWKQKFGLQLHKLLMNKQSFKKLQKIFQDFINFM